MVEIPKPSDLMDFMNYELKYVKTEGSVGWFSCLPAKNTSVMEAVEYLRNHPNDDFMHKYLLDLLEELDEHELEKLIEKGERGDFLLLASTYEASTLYEKFHNLQKKFEDVDIPSLANYTPFIYIKWSLDKNHPSRRFWMKVFSDNIYNHRPLPSLEDTEFPVPLKSASGEQKKVVHIKDVWSKSDTRSLNTGTSLRTVPPKETVKKALDSLAVHNLLTAWETRTDSSLSPYGLERVWDVDVNVSIGRNKWGLRGGQKSYGKGLKIYQARASYLMETVERYSAFSSFSDGQALGYKKEFNLAKSSYTDLKDKGIKVLDPKDVNLEVPYENQELYWIIADEIDGSGSRKIYVPAQLVFLFCNLDEASITTGITSNGLASGNTMDEAKLHALLECIERDSEKTVLYSQERCFLLEAEDSAVDDILSSCGKKGIYIQFLDITPEFGIPSYKAFIQTPTGGILKGCGAHLDGKIAAVRALTELSYPYPYWCGSIPPPKEFKTIYYENLPNYSSGNVGQDLRILENLLTVNGFHPIYVDLTRKDLGIPVVRAIIPGLEMMPVLDRFSNFNERQFRDYLKIIKAQEDR